MVPRVLRGGEPFRVRGALLLDTFFFGAFFFDDFLATGIPR